MPKKHLEALSLFPEEPEPQQSLPEAFRRVYYHLYSNSKASRAELIIEDLKFYNLAPGFALTSLERKSMIVSAEEHSGNFNDDSYTVYRLTGSGEDWLLENQDRLELRLQAQPTQKHVLEQRITDDQVPF